MPHYYPIYLDLTGKRCLVVGGGQVAERKVKGLLDARAQVRVVSPNLTPTLQHLADTQQIEAILTLYESAHLTDMYLIFAATDRREVNAQVAADALERNLFVNVADAPEEGAFHVPAVVRRGELCLSISTGGNNPLFAARLRDELETRYGPEYSALVELLGQMRSYTIKATDVPERRRAVMARLLDAEADLRALLRGEKPEEAEAKALALVREVLE